MMRIPMYAANWKMHKSAADVRAFFSEFLPLVGGLLDREIVIAPSFPALALAAELAKRAPVTIAAQNCHHEAKGAFTGEVAVGQIADAGARAVIVGHSERRHIFGETDAFLNRKLGAVHAAGLLPIFCVGELLEEREKGRTEEVLIRQIMEGLDGFDAESVYRFVIAYEPVWAIGTGRTATPDIAQEAHLFIRGLLAERFGGACAETMRILYGGSVKPDNIAGLMAMPDIDGVLVGGASLEAKSFAAIVAGA
jgi:triosephosphate isomerase